MHFFKIFLYKMPFKNLELDRNFSSAAFFVYCILLTHKIPTLLLVQFCTGLNPEKVVALLSKGNESLFIFSLLSSGILMVMILQKYSAQSLPTCPQFGFK